MNILAFDTGLNKTYLGLYIDGKISTMMIDSTENKYHSAFLIKKIVEILKNNNLTMQDINLVVTNIGPGSFTGIRVGLTVARTVAQGINADVVAINSLEMIAQTYQNAITILDARKNKAYIGNETFVDIVDLDVVPNKLKDFCGNVITDTKMSEFLSEKGIKTINFEMDNKDFAQTLITLGLEKYKYANFTKWQGLKPLYIQPPPIHQK